MVNSSKEKPFNHLMLRLASIYMEKAMFGVVAANLVYVRPPINVMDIIKTPKKALHMTS
jgi:hypothetical protein